MPEAVIERVPEAVVAEYVSSCEGPGAGALHHPAWTRVCFVSFQLGLLHLLAHCPLGGEVVLLPTVMTSLVALLLCRQLMPSAASHMVIRPHNCSAL